MKGYQSSEQNRTQNEDNHNCDPVGVLELYTELLFGNIVLALFGWLQQTIADVIEYELSIERTFELYTVDGHGGVSNDAGCLQVLQVLLQQLVVLGVIERFLKLSGQHFGFGGEMELAEALVAALFYFRDLRAFRVDALDVTPPL